MFVEVCMAKQKQKSLYISHKISDWSPGKHNFPASNEIVKSRYLHGSPIRSFWVKYIKFFLALTVIIFTHTHMQEVRARVGKLSQSYLNEIDCKNPYSTHEYIELGNRLVRSLVFLNVKFRKLSEVNGYYPSDGDSLNFDLKSLYTNQVYRETRFGWYLNVLEFIAGNGGKFKYCGLVDIDMTRDQSLEVIYREVMAEVLYQRNVNRRECFAWFTGKKGFRIGFLPGFDGIKREPSELFLYQIGSGTKPKKPELFSALLNGMIDDSIYVTGHGVKFDLMHHPDTKRLPVFLTGDPETDMAKILGTCRTFTSELCSIGGFWVDLFTELEMILKNPSDTMLLSEEIRTRTPLTPKSREVVDDTVVDPLVHVVSITDRGQVRDVCRDFMGDSLGNDPFTVLLMRFSKEVNYRGHDLPQARVKIISDDILVMAFRTGKCDLVCPLHNKRHTKNSGKVYVVYARNALHFSIRCHSTTTGTKEVRVPLFADQHLITGFLETTLNEIAPYTTTINAPFIGDMLVKDPRFSNKDVILLRSAMGSGKTVAISSLIKDMAEKIGEESLRVLVISTRRTCMMMLADLFDVAKYLNSSNGIVRDDIHMMDKVVVSMESLHRVIPPGSVNVVKRFDLVVLDECESILANFSSMTMKHKRKNYQLLKAIIETNGTKTVFSDAFLGECTVQFLLTSGLAQSKNWSLIVNTHNKSTTKYELFPEHCSFAFTWEYRLAVTTNQRFVFASDRIDCITYFQDLLVTFLEPEELKKKKVLTITAGSARDVIASASDCKSWEDYDYIFYSPAVTVGNSYAPEDPTKRFDLVFGVFTGTATTLDAIQMTGRARSLKRSVAKILLTQTTIINGRQYVGDRESISNYIENRITGISDELGEILRADRNKSLARTMSEQIPDSQLITDLSSSADSILIVPKETDMENIKIEMPVPYLETIFTINVVNERKSKYMQLEHWRLYLSTTFLSYVIVTQPPSQKPPPSIMAIILSKRKQYEERRKLANDEYSSDLILTGEDLKKKKEEERVMSDVTTDEVNIRKIQSLLGNHMSQELSRMIEKIQSGNVSQIKDLPVNWDRFVLFLSAHVRVECLERFYYFIRNIERPIEAIKHTELLGTQIKDTSEFLGRGSLILGHLKPFYDHLMKDLVKAAFHLRNKTTWGEMPEWIAPDRTGQFMYLDITAFFCLNTDKAYKILCEFFNDESAIKEGSIYYGSQPLKLMANKHLKPCIEKVFSKYPEVEFTSAIGEFQKLNLKSKSCSLMSVSISGILLVLTKYFPKLFGGLFQKTSWEEQKRLGFMDARRRYQGVRSHRVRFRDDLYENSKSLSLLVFEDKMEFLPEYSFFDMISQ
jgi:hypothetical protein